MSKAFNCPHCGFFHAFDSEECPACLQDVLSTTVNEQAIFDRVFKLTDRVEELEAENKKLRPFEHKVQRIPLPIGFTKIVWLELPVDCTSKEKAKLIKIIGAICEFELESPAPADDGA